MNICSVNPLILLEPKQYHFNHICETKWKQMWGAEISAPIMCSHNIQTTPQPLGNLLANQNCAEPCPDLRCTTANWNHIHLSTPPDTPTKSMMIKNIMALLEFKQLVGSTKNGLHVSANHFHLIHGPQQQKTNTKRTNKQKKTRHTTYHDHQCTSMMHQSRWCLQYALWKTLRSPHFFRLRPEQVSILLC